MSTNTDQWVQTFTEAFTPELPEVYCANHCAWVGMEADLISDDAGSLPHCPECDSNSAIMEIPDEWQGLMECVSAVRRWKQEDNRG